MALNHTRQMQIAILGGGSRGAIFGKILTEKFGAKIVALAEPRPQYRTKLGQQLNIPANRQFASWRDFINQSKMCDAVVITTSDQEHAAPAIICLEKGYDLLLEKPMATTLEECRAIEAAQRKTGGIVAVCHSLRYQKGFRKVYDLVKAGALGKIITLDLLESVGVGLQTHCFVRGDWGNEERTTFMLMAKSCHDIDYLAFLAQAPCRRVASFGALTYYRREHAPAGSPERCTDGCPVEATCPYSAYKYYVHTPNRSSMVSPDPSRAAHLKAIKEGPFGRCIFKCDNNVVDHQVVILEFAEEITATFTMTAFGAGGRHLRVHGTEGMLFFNENSIALLTFHDNNIMKIELKPEEGSHGGGDERIVRKWLQALHSRDASAITTDAKESLRTHTIVFAAEKARREKRVVDVTSV